MALTDWLTFVSSSEIRKQKAYIDLPAFSYASQGTVGQASIIVAQFNFSASKDFYLLTRPTKPAGVSFGLCIRYRIGETVYRYKLWEDDQFVLSSATLSYNKQLIKKNFVLEVWNFSGVASVNSSALRMITSVRSVPTDYRSITDYALAVGAEFTDFASADPTLPTGATLRWTNFATSAGTVDTIGGNVLLEYGADIAPVSYNAADTSFLKGYAQFPDQSNILRCGNLTGTWNAFTAYLVFAADPLDVSLAKMLMAMTSGNYSTIFSSVKLGATNKARCGGSTGYYDLTIADANAHILKIAKQQDADVLGRIDEDTGSSTSTGLASTSGLKLQLGGFSGYVSNNLKLAEALFFNGQTFTDGDTSDVQTLQYLRWYHFGEIPLPTSFNAGGPWLDNTP